MSTQYNHFINEKIPFIRHMIQVRDLEEILAARAQKCKETQSTIKIYKSNGGDSDSMTTKNIALLIGADGSNRLVYAVQIPIHILSGTGHTVIGVFDKDEALKLSAPVGEHSFFDAISFYDKSNPVTRYFSTKNQIYVARNALDVEMENFKHAGKVNNELLEVIKKHNKNLSGINIKPKFSALLNIRVQAADAAVIVRAWMPPVYIVGDAHYTGHLWSGSVFNSSVNAINIKLAMSSVDRLIRKNDGKTDSLPWDLKANARIPNDLAII